MDEQKVRNSDGSYMSEPQIVNYMISTLIDDKSKIILATNFEFDPFETEESKEASKTTGFNIKNYYRTTFGRQIRNTFGLWNEDNPYVCLNYYVCLNTELNADKTIDHPLHPDQISARVIEQLVNYYSDQL